MVVSGCWRSHEAGISTSISCVTFSAQTDSILTMVSQECTHLWWGVCNGRRPIPKHRRLPSQEANLVEKVEDSPDFWSGPVQSYNSPVEHRFLIGLDRSTNSPLPDCDRKYVSVRTMPPGIAYPPSQGCSMDHRVRAYFPIDKAPCWLT